MIQQGQAGSATSRYALIRAVTISTSLPKTDLVAATSGLVCKYWIAGPNAVVTVTLSDLASITTAWTSGKFLHIGGGYYLVCKPNAARASGDFDLLWFEGVTDVFFENVSEDHYGSDPRAAAPTLAQIGGAPWDAFTADHMTSGTYGLALGGGVSVDTNAIRLALWNSPIDPINGFSANKVMQMMLTYVGASRVTQNALGQEVMTMAGSNFSIGATFTRSLAADGVTVIYDRAQPSFANLTDAS